MIALLRGRVHGRTGNSVVLDVNGVGYLVQASQPTLLALGAVGDEATLLVHTQVREDAITLFGFGDAEEREVFLMLLAVQGVGPKAALALLSHLGPAGTLSALAAGNAKALSGADGVGPKLAARLASELGAKAAKAGAVPAVAAVEVRGTATPGPVDDARAALLHLGFPRLETEALLSAVLAGPNPPSDTAAIVKACLRATQARAA